MAEQVIDSYAERCANWRQCIEALEAELANARESTKILSRHMDAVWAGVFPKSYGGWGYGGEFERHVLAVVSEMRAALRRHATHSASDPMCERIKGENYPCTCGLDTTLHRTRGRDGDDDRETFMATAIGGPFDGKVVEVMAQPAMGSLTQGVCVSAGQSPGICYDPEKVKLWPPESRRGWYLGTPIGNSIVYWQGWQAS